MNGEVGRRVSLLLKEKGVAVFSVGVVDDWKSLEGGVVFAHSHTQNLGRSFPEALVLVVLLTLLCPPPSFGRLLADLTPNHLTFRNAVRRTSIRKVS